MRILQVCKKFPFPLKDGEAIAVNSLSKALSSLGCEVTVLAMNTRKDYFNLRKLPTEFNHYADIHTVDVDNRIKPRDAFLNLFSKESYHISRFVSTAFQEQLIRLLRKGNYDIVQLETLYLAPYYSGHPPALRRNDRYARAQCRIGNLEGLQKTAPGDLKNGT